MKKYFDVRCPYCFEQLRYNDAVFRCKSGTEQKDEYLKSYKAHLEDRDAQDLLYDFVDPADPRYSNYKRNFEDGCYLTGIEDPDKGTKGFLNERLCPYCHNKLLKRFGRAPAKYIAVIGVPGSGKTTYLASINEMMRKRSTESFSWINMDSENRDHSLEAIARMYAEGSIGAATQSVQGPYFRELEINKNKTDIVFLDIPGECYIDKERLTERIVDYVKYSDGLIFIVNAAETVENNGEEVLGKTVDKVLGILRENDIPKKPTAIMLNKVDKVKSALVHRDSLGDFFPPITSDAVDMRAVERKSADIIHSMLWHGGDGDGADIQANLRGYVNNIIRDFGEDCRVFATRLVLENHLVLNQGFDTPFLWLLAKMGVFPVKQEKK